MCGERNLLQQLSICGFPNIELMKGEAMFGFGSKKEKLEKKLHKLLDDAYRLSHSDRNASDAKAAEADEVRKQLDALEATES